MTPERAECIAWLERNGFTVYTGHHGRIIVAKGEAATTFASAAQAYRRLGGPHTGEMGSDPKRVGPSAGGEA